MRSRTSPARGPSTSTISMLRGLPASQATAARAFISLAPPWLSLLSQCTVEQVSHPGKQTSDNPLLSLEFASLFSSSLTPAPQWRTRPPFYDGHSRQHKGGPMDFQEKALPERPSQALQPARQHLPSPYASRVHRGLTVVLLGLLSVGVVLSLLQGNWLTAAATAGVLAVALMPFFLGRRFDIRVPAEFESLAVVFVYASLFLGELRGYYIRYWWWDSLLHTCSGFLLGILGFLLVHVLNEKRRIDNHMNPGFVALFAFSFALAAGTLWEILDRKSVV